MAQFASYPLTTELSASDLFLKHSASAGIEQTITAASVADAFATFYTQPTIQELRDQSVANTVDGSGVVVGGYYAIGDGGGGQFYYDASETAADNGGTILAPTTGSGRWKRPASNRVNVRQFGAVGDGSANDTTAIQNALNYAKTLTNANLHFPAGDYKITSTIVLTTSPAVNLSVTGEGNNVSVITVATANTNGFKFSFENVGATQPYGVRFQNLCLKTSAGGGTAIVVSYGNPPTTNNHAVQTVVVDSCAIVSGGNSGDSWRNGIDITSGWNCQISNTFISGNSQGGTWTNLAGDAIIMRRYCVNSCFSNVNVGFFENAFHWVAGGSSASDGNTEGLNFSNFCATATRRGVYIEGNGSATVPRMSGLQWVGGLLDLRGPIAAFDLVNVQDAMISSCFMVEAGASGTNYGVKLTTCGDISVNNCEFFVFDYGVYTTGTCFAVNVKNCTFRGGNIQVEFGASTTNSRSGGHVIKDVDKRERNSGGNTNRIYVGDALGVWAYLTSDESTATGVAENLAFDATLYDDLGAWSAGQPARLTVPSGVHWVRLSAGIRWDASTAGTRKVRIQSDSGPSDIWGADEKPTGGYGDCMITTGIIDCTGITYFEVNVFQDSGGAVNVRAVDGTYLAMEIIG